MKIVWLKERCIRQFALIADKNAMSHSNQTRIDRFTAENAGRREGPKEEDFR
jgi:hypothetical protein